MSLLSSCEMRLYFRFSRASARLSFPGVSDLVRWDKRRQDRRKVSNGIHFIDPRGQTCVVSAAAQETEVLRLEPRLKTHIGFFLFFSPFLLYARKHRPLCWQNQIVFRPTFGPLHVSGCRPRLSSPTKMCLCDTDRETLCDNSVCADWHWQRVVSVHMVAKAEEDSFVLNSI